MPSTILRMLYLALLMPNLGCFGYSPPSLAPRKFEPLPVGSVTPSGWLKKQLVLQAEGLSGHLSQFWVDVVESVWVGGHADLTQGLSERTPYWLNGIVPLAFLLENAGITEMPGVKGIWKAKQVGGDPKCEQGVDMPHFDLDHINTTSADDCHQRCSARLPCHGYVYNSCKGECFLKLAESQVNRNASSCLCYGVAGHAIPPINLMGQVERYVSHILDFQNATGWFGPAHSNSDDYWSRSNVVLALAQYAEGKGRGSKEWERVTKALLDYMLQLIPLLKEETMGHWSTRRWQDIMLGLQWVIANTNNTEKAPELWSLARTMKAQGADWETWFQDFETGGLRHNVNNAQALKSAAVWYLISRNETLRNLSVSRMQNLDDTFGLPTGMFNGDEQLPDPPTRNPSRGIELCGVVEAMFSYNTMFSVFGDVAFADRAERIAYNALPATWASPRGGDMWAHQYLQAVNEIRGEHQDSHVWTHDGPDAEMYGLEPNYGCCTANFNQGWPKFAQMLIYATQDDGAAIGAFAPATARLPARVGGGGAEIEIATEYPFGDTVTIRASGGRLGFPLYLRIPKWAVNATLNGTHVGNSTSGMYKLVVPPQKVSVWTLDTNPEIRVERWGDRGKQQEQAAPVSVHRGPLMFSLPLEASFGFHAHYFGEPGAGSYDWNVQTADEWKYALDVSLSSPELSFSFQKHASVDESMAPFNHTGWPVSVAARARKVFAWGEYKGSAAAPPPSPACLKPSSCGDVVNVQLVPHGGTDLRIGEFPISGVLP